MLSILSPAKSELRWDSKDAKRNFTRQNYIFIDLSRILLERFPMNSISRWRCHQNRLQAPYELKWAVPENQRSKLLYNQAKYYYNNNDLSFYQDLSSLDKKNL